jgi:membrane associated rhomboid family serine protease
MFFPLHDDNTTRRRPWVTYGIIAVNALVFLWLAHLPGDKQEWVVFHRGFIPERISQLADPRPLVVPQQSIIRHPLFGRAIIQRNVSLDPDRKEILLSLLTCLFLHGGWMHLIGNMWFLFVFGNNVEDRLGHFLFLLFYLVGGVLASAAHWAISPDSVAPIIGASGAVAAVLGAYAVTWPWARVHTLVFLVVFITIIEVPALLVLGIWFLAQLLEGHAQLSLNTSGGVAWWAHVGGFLAGMALMPLLCMLRDVNNTKALPVEVVQEKERPW